ncbi:hypothetical protein TNIN_306491 [Trichonephila inaurata madagascariensis]|uniref:Uncharacterized protein n=1 Tax=Trichonephila inaurata madagascariensis TaxID=2747483 RepID=A0A8X6Y7V8_9ARAC|nr:hypothetical protein TNIN_306491 [Trichonephila inaurata madagascariensis]
MSDYSGNLDFSPTRQAKIAACEKLRDTVTGISALHKSLLDESLASSPTHRNSFSEIYRMSTQAMAMKKEEMLPTSVQTILTSITPITVEKAAEVTDRILEVSTSNVSLSTNAIASSSENHILQEIERLNKRIDHLTMRQRTPERRNNSRP